MPTDRAEQLRRIAGGSPRPRRVLTGGVAALLGCSSVGFLLGVDGMLGWVGVPVTFVIAGAAGWAGAGVGPTAVVTWGIGWWWTAFRPLVGYLTGNWAIAGRYTYPRQLDYGYTTASGELIGGMQYGVEVGALFAVLGVSGYLVGVGGRRCWRFCLGSE